MSTLEIPELRQDEISRFHSLVTAGSPDDCWPWSGHKNRGYYGIFIITRVRGKSIHLLAHRVAAKLAGIDLSGGLYACHRCDNPPCCNAAHLFAGTVQDNARDCYEKGRMTIAWKKPIGEQHGNARLTEFEVREIRRLYSAGGMSQKSLAQKFGVVQGTISAIVTGQTWKHILEVTTHVSSSPAE